MLTTLGTLCGVLLSPQETTDIPKFKLSVGHMPSTHRPPSQPLPQGRESGLLSGSRNISTSFHTFSDAPGPQGSLLTPLHSLYSSFCTESLLFLKKFFQVSVSRVANGLVTSLKAGIASLCFSPGPAAPSRCSAYV